MEVGALSRKVGSDVGTASLDEIVASLKKELDHGMPPIRVEEAVDPVRPLSAQ
jgi:hypothetical protein